jgi:hypothetical protein
MFACSTVKRLMQDTSDGKLSPEGGAVGVIGIHVKMAWIRATTQIAGNQRDDGLADSLIIRVILNNKCGADFRTRRVREGKVDDDHVAAPDHGAFPYFR